MKVTISTIKYNQFTIFSENRKYNFLRWEIVVLQRYFYLRKTTYSSVCVFERLLFPVVSSLLIPLGKSACYFFPLKVLFLKKQDFLECWVPILKIVSLLGSYTSNGEKLQNRVCYLGNSKLSGTIGSKASKISCTKTHICSREKGEFSGLGRRRYFNTSRVKIWLLGLFFLGLQRWPLLKKKNQTRKPSSRNTSKWANSCMIIPEHSLLYILKASSVVDSKILDILNYQILFV